MNNALIVIDYFLLSVEITGETRIKSAENMLRRFADVMTHEETEQTRDIIKRIAKLLEEVSE